LETSYESEKKAKPRKKQSEREDARAKQSARQLLGLWRRKSLPKGNASSAKLRRKLLVQRSIRGVGAVPQLKFSVSVASALASEVAPAYVLS
jgi:hypothetical protein